MVSHQSDGHDRCACESNQYSGNMVIPYSLDDFAPHDYVAEPRNTFAASRSQSVHQVGYDLVPGPTRTIYTYPEMPMGADSILQYATSSHHRGLNAGNLEHSMQPASSVLPSAPAPSRQRAGVHQGRSVFQVHEHDSESIYPSHPQARPTETITFIDMNKVYQFIIKRILLLTADPIGQIIQTLIHRMVPDRRGRYMYQRNLRRNDDGGPAWFHANPSGIPWAPGPHRMKNKDAASIIAYIFMMPHFAPDHTEELMQNADMVPPEKLNASTPWHSTLEWLLRDPWHVPKLHTNYPRKKNDGAQDIVSPVQGKTRGNTTKAEIDARCGLLKDTLNVARDVEKVATNQIDDNVTADVPVPSEPIRKEPYGGGKSRTPKRGARNLSSESGSGCSTNSAKNEPPKRRRNASPAIKVGGKRKKANSRKSKAGKPGRHSKSSSSSSTVLPSEPKLRYPEEPQAKKQEAEDTKMLLVPHDEDWEAAPDVDDGGEATDVDESQHDECIDLSTLYRGDDRDVSSISNASTSFISTGFEPIRSPADDGLTCANNQPEADERMVNFTPVHSFVQEPCFDCAAPVRAPAQYGSFLSDLPALLPSAYARDVPQPQTGVPHPMRAGPPQGNYCAWHRCNNFVPQPDQQWYVNPDGSTGYWVNNEEVLYHTGNCNCGRYVDQNQARFPMFFPPPDCCNDQH